MKLRQVMACLIAVIALSGPGGLVAQGPNSALSQAMRSYQNLDFETTADLLRRTLNRSSLPPEEQTQALSYLGASEFFLGHREAALAAFRQIVVLDLRDRPDPLVFPPEVQQVYEEARRGVKTVQVQLAPRTEIRIGESTLPVRLFASSYQDVGVAIANQSGGAVHWIYTGPIADSVDLAWDGLDAAGNLLASGTYVLRVTTKAPQGTGRVLRTVDIPLDLTVKRPDTLPPPRPIDPSQFRPEFNRNNLVMGAARGMAIGIAALALPAIVGADSVQAAAPLLVGLAIGASSIVGLVTHPAGKPIAANVAFNRQLRETWKRQADSIAEENARRRKDTRLLVRAGEPVVREAGEQ